jgi:hypothetical protein
VFSWDTFYAKLKSTLYFLPVSTQHINYNQADIPCLLKLQINQILMYYLFEVIFVYLMSVYLLPLQIFANKFSQVFLKDEDS